MKDNVCTMFKRTEQERGGKGVVHQNRNTMCVGNIGNGFKVRDIDGRIAKAFQINGFGLIRNQISKRLWVIRIGELP